MAMMTLLMNIKLMNEKADISFQNIMRNSSCKLIERCIQTKVEKNLEQNFGIQYQPIKNTMKLPLHITEVTKLSIIT